MTKKKMIVGIVLAVVLTVGLVGVVKSFDKGFDNSEQPVVEEQRKLELTLDYKEVPKEGYVVNVDEDEIVIKTEDIEPKIDTTKIGESSYEVEVNDEVFSLLVVVKDNRIIVLEGEKEFTIEAGSMDKEEFEQMLFENFDTDVEEDDKLDFSFTYSKEFDLDQEGEHDVTVTARFLNNTKNRISEKVNIEIIEVEEEIETSEEVDKGSTEVANSSSDNTKLNPAPSKPAQSKSESTPEPTSEPSKPEPTLEPSKSESAPEPSKSEPIPETSKSEPTPESSKPESSTGTPVPSGIPSGASYVKGDKESHRFDYSSSLPNGGSVTRATVNFVKERVIILGTDNSGRGFGAVYKRSSLGFMYGAPDLDDADKSALRKIGRDFLSAYGK